MRSRLFLALLVLCAPLAQATPVEDATKVARAAYDNKQFAQSAAAYSKATALAPSQWWHAFNAACSYALAGDKELAFQFLVQAVDAKFHDATSMEKDTDLISLHDDPRWPALVERVKAQKLFRNKLHRSPAFDTPLQENISENEKLAGLARFWSEVKYNLPEQDVLRRADWDALFVAYLPKVKATTSTAAYYAVMVQLAETLNYPGTSVSYPNELRKKLFAYPPFMTRLVEGRILVDEVHDTALHDKGVVPGTEVTSVDGVAAVGYAREHAQPMLVGQSLARRQAKEAGYLFMVGPVERPSRVRFARPDGSQFELPVSRFSPEERAKRDTQNEFTVSTMPDNIAYVRFNSLDRDEVNAVLAGFDGFDKAAAMIIDVRDVQFGDLESMANVLKFLLPQPLIPTRRLSRVHKAMDDRYFYTDTAAMFDDGPLVPHDRAHQFTNPVLVLTSALTANEAERLVSTMVETKRATIIGERTAGDGCATVIMPLPGGGHASVCTMRSNYPNDMQRGGVGIAPDISVSPTVDDMRKGRDTVLEVALDAARQANAARKK